MSKPADMKSAAFMTWVHMINSQLPLMPYTFKCNAFDEMQLTVILERSVPKSLQQQLHLQQRLGASASLTNMIQHFKVIELSVTPKPSLNKDTGRHNTNC